MKFINKDAIAERIGEIKARIGCDRFLSEYEQGVNFGKKDVCEEIEYSLDTFEGKDIDIEKEIKEVQRYYKTIDEYEGYLAHMSASDIEWVAKHFFELGLNASMQTK